MNRHPKFVGCILDFMCVYQLENVSLQWDSLVSLIKCKNLKTLKFSNTLDEEWSILEQTFQL